MTRRVFSRKFKHEAAQLGTLRGVNRSGFPGDR